MSKLTVLNQNFTFFKEKNITSYDEFSFRLSYMENYDLFLKCLNNKKYYDDNLLDVFNKIGIDKNKPTAVYWYGEEWEVKQGDKIVFHIIYQFLGKVEEKDNDWEKFNEYVKIRLEDSDSYPIYEPFLGLRKAGEPTALFNIFIEDVVE